MVEDGDPDLQASVAECIRIPGCATCLTTCFLCLTSVHVTHKVTHKVVHSFSGMISWYLMSLSLDCLVSNIPMNYPSAKWDDDPKVTYIYQHIVGIVFVHTLHERRSPCHVINVIHASFPWQSHRLNAPCAITAGRTNFRGRSALEEQTSKYLTTLLHTMDTMVCFAPSCTLPIFHGVIYVYNCLYVFCNFNMKWSLDLFSIQQMMISSSLFRQALSETCKQFFPKWV